MLLEVKGSVVFRVDRFIRDGDSTEVVFNFVRQFSFAKVLISSS